MTHIETFAALVRAEIRLWNSLDSALLADAGITVATFQSLSTIAALDAPARVQDISDSMLITVGATSKLVDRLERDGLVTRAANPNDRRSSLIVLTDAGTVTLAAASVIAETHLARAFGSGVDLTRLTGELDALTGAAS